jgi:hypothetical protein
MLRNPFQLVIWNESGDVVHREHIGAFVAKLGPGGDEKLYKRFPSVKEILRNRIFVYKGNLYCDFDVDNSMKRIGEEAWNYLFDLRVPHPYSDDFQESVTNSIIWYDEADPRIEIVAEGSSYVLNVRSPGGRMMKIPIRTKN